MCGQQRLVNYSDILQMEQEESPVNQTATDAHIKFRSSTLQKNREQAHKANEDITAALSVLEEY